MSSHAFGAGHFRRQPDVIIGEIVERAPGRLSVCFERKQIRLAHSCPSRKSHPALKELQLERSSVILLYRPAHPYSDGLLHIYGPHLRSLCAHPEPHPVPNSARYRESRHASATGRPQPIVKPETVIKWHRQGFKLYWRWKSKAPVGRPKIDKEIRELIRKMSRENPLWGVPRIQAELRLLGLDLAESTVLFHNSVT